MADRKDAKTAAAAHDDTGSAAAATAAAADSSAVELKATHPGVACDACQTSPIRGVRYHCSVCENFDLCSKCEESGALPSPTSHDASHPLLKLRTSDAIGHLVRRGQGHDPALFCDAATAQDYVCAICLCVASDAVRTRCRHVFCTRCLHFALAAKRECPLCRTALPREVNGGGGGNSSNAALGMPLDVSVRRTIDALHVRCPHTDLGCAWTGALGDVTAHTRDTCAYVACPMARFGCNARCARAGGALATHLHTDAAQHLALYEARFDDTAKQVTALTDQTHAMGEYLGMLAAGQNEVFAFFNQIRGAFGLDAAPASPAQAAAAARQSARNNGRNGGAGRAARGGGGAQQQLVQGGGAGAGAGNANGNANGNHDNNGAGAAAPANSSSTSIANVVTGLTITALLAIGTVSVVRWLWGGATGGSHSAGNSTGASK